MDGREFTKQEFTAMTNRLALWKMENPGASPTEELRTLLRQYEKHNWGVTSRELALGSQVDYVQDDGKWLKVESKVRGYFKSNPEQKGHMPECHFEATKWKVANGKRMSYQEYLVDKQVVKSNRDIKLAAHAPTPDVHDTGETGATTSQSLMDTGVLSGFGSATGVITPVFMNMLMEKWTLMAFMKNFFPAQPMPSMSFYFPMKYTKTSDISEFSSTSLPTPEGRAGQDFEIEWTKWEVNGWKYLRHFELTDEINEMLGQFIAVNSKYVEDIAIGMALLWDYTISLGIQTMLTRGVWRYPYWNAGTSTYTWHTTGAPEEEIPWGKASVLTTNAKNNYLFQDLSGLTTGIIYEPNVTTTLEFIYDASTARATSAAADELIEGIMAIATLLKNKGSAMEYVIFTDSMQVERLFKDADMRNLQIRSGDPKFQDERGYLGKIAIGGSASFVDLWEAPQGLIPPTDSDVTTGTTYSRTGISLYPIICGKYGSGWNHGVFSPFTMRVDDGFEAYTDGTTNRMRPTESKVTTASQKGSSWPGDYHDVAILWESRTAHP